MRAIIGTVVALACLAFSPSIHAETSSEYAKMGQKIWPAFQCAIAAGKAGKGEAQEQLFKHGYDNGKAFLTALAEGKIDEPDIRSSVAIGTTLRLQGPSADFMLGRIWEAVADEYYRKAKDTCPECGSDDEFMKMNAKTRYSQMNCDLLE